MNEIQKEIITKLEELSITKKQKEVVELITLFNEAPEAIEQVIVALSEILKCVTPSEIQNPSEQKDILFKSILKANEGIGKVAENTKQIITKARPILLEYGQ